MSQRFSLSSDSGDANEVISDQSYSPAKKWAFRLFAIGIGLGTGFLIFHFFLEDWSRELKIELTDEPIYLQEPGHERTGHKYLYDPELGWRNIPNWSATTNGYPLTINSQGLRGREYPYQKSKGTKRILVLGDSFAWGYGVADGAIFTDTLEDLLNESSSSIAYEVINTGVSGWGTDQELLFLQQEGFDYSPDVVVLAFFIVNDIQNNGTSIQYGMQKPIFLTRELDIGNSPVPKPIVQKPPLTSGESPLSITMAIIQQMQLECQKRHCDFHVMKFGQFLPNYRHHPLYEEFNKALATECAKLKIPYYDLDNEFRLQNVSAETILRGNDDGHWNAEGHRLAGRFLYQSLSKDILSGQTRFSQNEE